MARRPACGRADSGRGSAPMDLDPRLQRAFDRVELVSGSIGNPGDGRMCIMSLVLLCQIWQKRFGISSLCRTRRIRPSH